MNTILTQNSETESTMSLIETAQLDSTLIVRIKCAQFDHVTASQIQREVIDASLATPDKPVVVDLALVDLVNSTGMSMIVGLKQYMDRHSRPMVLAALRPQVLAYFQKAHLDMLLEMYEDCETAAGKVGQSLSA